MDWINLTQQQQIEKMDLNSFENISLCFKHSTRCSISSMALNRIESEWNNCNAIPYYLDLLSYINLSNIIAEKYDVVHESPQVLLIKNGNCINHLSHTFISMNQINKYING